MAELNRNRGVLSGEQERALEAKRVAWNRAQQPEVSEQVPAPIEADLAESIETTGGVA